MQKSSNLCKYPGCKKKDINSYGLCKDHYVDYGKKAKLSIKQLQNLIKQRAAKADPTSRHVQEALIDAPAEQGSFTDIGDF